MREIIITKKKTISKHCESEIAYLSKSSNLTTYLKACNHEFNAIVPVINKLASDIFPSKLYPLTM